MSKADVFGTPPAPVETTERWQKQEIPSDPARMAGQLKDCFRSASTTGMESYGFRYNVDDVAEKLKGVMENMDWEKMAVAELTNEEDRNNYIRARFLLLNMRGSINNPDAPGFSSKEQLMAAVAEIEEKTKRFWKPQEE